MEYYASHQRDSAATLVRLALIFNFICLGFDALAVLGGLVLAIVFGTGVIPRGPDDPPSWVMGLLFAGGTMLFSAFSTGKFVAMWRVKKRRPNAWAWGLAAGIAGCVQIMCGFYCCLQVATGIFTVVVFALGNVRNYLAEETVQ